MSPRDPGLPPEPAPDVGEVREDLLAPTGEALALPPGEAAQAAEDAGEVQGAQIWALHPLMRPDVRAAEEAPQVDLLRLLPEAARRGRRLLVLGLLAGFAFGAAYLLVAAPVYVVKALVQVELRRSVIRDLEVHPASTYVGTQAEVIQSPAIVADAIRAIGLPEPDEAGLLRRMRDWIEAMNPFRSEEIVDPIERAVLATLPALQATPVLGTDVLAVTLRTDAPQRGVRLLDALVASFRGYVRENETAAHREGLDLLRRREADLAAQIAERTASYQRRESAIRSLGEGADAQSAQRSGLEERARARLEAELRRIDLENELAALREQGDAGVAPSVRIQDDLSRSEAALAELRQQLSDRHPDVARMEQRVAGLREQVRAGARSRIEELERQVLAARRTETALASLYEGEWERTKALERERSELARSGAEIARLEEERGKVLGLLAEKELALLAAEGDASSRTLIHLLQAPSVPPSPEWPLPLPVLAGCSLVGLLGGLAFALFAQGREVRARAFEPGGFADPADFDATVPRIAGGPVQGL